MKMLLASSKALNRETRKAIKKIAKNAKSKKEKQRAIIQAQLIALNYSYNTY